MTTLLFVIMIYILRTLKTKMLLSGFSDIQNFFIKYKEYLRFSCKKKLTCSVKNQYFILIRLKVHFSEISQFKCVLIVQQPAKISQK